MVLATVLLAHDGSQQRVITRALENPKAGSIIVVTLRGEHLVLRLQSNTRVTRPRLDTHTDFRRPNSVPARATSNRRVNVGKHPM